MTARLLLTVDTGNPTPPYEQLRRQLTELIQSAALAPGDRLPPLRQLAADLGLAVGTVARAYRELESAGVVETRGRFGTYVARVDPADAAMATAAHTFVSAAKALGIDKSDALRYVESAFG